jgi:hypothetical protein
MQFSNNLKLFYMHNEDLTEFSIFLSLPLPKKKTKTGFWRTTAANLPQTQRQIYCELFAATLRRLFIMQIKFAVDLRQT